MALPAALLFGAFFLYPLGRGVWLSLTDWSGLGASRFVGLDNFASFLGDPRALRDLGTTLLFALGSAPLLNIFGMALALLVDREGRASSGLRALVYLPAVVSPLIMGYLWYFILQPERGWLASIAASAFSSWRGFDWYSSGGAAVLVLVMVNVWQYAGMTMVVYLAGLQAVPQELLEAARIDGATKWRMFRSVKLPLLMPSVKVNVVTNIIGSLSVFDVVVSLTDGGPGYATESLSLYIFRMCYGGSVGYSTAVALVLFLLILVPVALYLAMTRKLDVEL
jgi:raffinose/stachyose/melibiose transport system permease protein